MAGPKYGNPPENIFNPEWLKAHFRYDRRGFLVRKKYMGGPTKAGEIIRGCGTGTSGYRTLNICYKNVLLHRVIFCLVKGWLPQFIDHKDRNRFNNRIENLRPATTKLNTSNRSVAKGTISGVRGVTFIKRKKLWRGRLTVNGKSISVGSSKDKNKIIKRIQKFQRKIIAELVSKTETKEMEK